LKTSPPDPDRSLPVFINGKFTRQHTTGVQRTAAGLLTALDAELDSMPAHRRGTWVLLCPPDGVPPALRHIEVRVLGREGGSMLHWEQWLLPRAAAGGLLMSLAGSAPAFHRRQVCMLHDAAIFDRPEAYTLLFRSWYRMLFTWLSYSAHTLLTVSEYSKIRLCSHLRVRPDRLHVVLNGADHLAPVEPDDSVFPYYGIEPRRFILAVASSNPNKNLLRLEAAMRRLHDETGLRLVLVGGINSRVFARSAADDIGDRVVIVRTGPVSDAQLKALYQNAVALVFPSLYEGFGLPPLEAMSCGCPVLAAKATAIPEVCGEGADYFDPHSLADIERSVRGLVDAPERQTQLRDAGFGHVRSFRWADSARRLLEHAHAAARA